MANTTTTDDIKKGNCEQFGEKEQETKGRKGRKRKKRKKRKREEYTKNQRDISGRNKDMHQ